MENQVSEFASVISQYVGQTIRDITVTPELVTLTFDHGKLELSDDASYCCERRYITCDDDTNYHKGAKLLGVEIGSCSETVPDDIDQDAHAVQFLIIRTNRGVITAATHNEHNGYYGGFYIQAHHG